MDSETYARVQRLSSELVGNNVLLPVAAAIVCMSDTGPLSTPQVTEELGGRLPPNRVAQALQRLHRIGAVMELPYPGRPHPRLYERRESPFWTFVREWTLDPMVDRVET